MHNIRNPIIYAIQEYSDKKYDSGVIQNHYDMNSWLETNGRKEYTYEVHKGSALHSVWIWKEKTERWDRTSTPSKKLEKTSDEDKHNDRLSKKKDRQEKAKMNRFNTDRPPRG